ncbi:MAG TPA: hemolysin family protein [Elusimicrobiota bacterium]|nr:hemolysin family protein [Elusimicrobiota bacterium]
MILFWGGLLMGVFFLTMSGFFSASETALMSLSKIQLGRLGKVYPGRLTFWEKDADRVLAVILLANTLVNVALGVLATALAVQMEKVWGVPFRWGGWVVPVMVGVLLIFVGEIVPKLVARAYTESLALKVAVPMRLITRALGPVVQGLVWMIGRALAVISRSVRAEGGQWNVRVIRHLLDKTTLAPSVRSVLNNILDFGNLPVSRIMVPRDEIFAVDIALPKSEFVARVLSSGYSRVLVYKGNLDEIVGVVYTKDLLAFWRGESLIVVTDLIRAAFRVTEGVPVAQLLREFRQGKYHMAVVLDRNRRVQGLVTLQDILETIVGDIAESPELGGSSAVL